MTLPSCRAGRIAGVLLLVLLLVGSCRGRGTPQEELRAALDATRSTDVAFVVSAAAEGRTVEAFGAGAELATGVLDAARVTGVRRADGTVQAALDIGGTAPLFELRTDADGVLLRAGLPELLAVGDEDPVGALAPRLDELGIDGDGRAALLAGFAGDWIELTGVGDEAAADAAIEVPDDPLDALEVVARHEDADGRTRFEVEVATAALRGWFARTLGDPLLRDDAPAVVPGSVTVHDGQVHELHLELRADDPDGDGDRPSDGDASGGVLRLVVAVDDHGRATLPPVPAPVASVSAAELQELVRRLAGA